MKRTKQKLQWRWLTAAILTLTTASPLSAAFPNEITYQGSLKQNGTPVNGTYSMEFRLTNWEGSQVYWTSGAQNVQVTEGLYRVSLAPTSFDWPNAEPYILVSVGGNQLLPPEKLNSAPYALVAKDLAANATASGGFNVLGKLGIGTTAPIPKLHIYDNTPANYQDQFIYQAESIPPGNPYELRLGFRGNIPAIQSNQVGVGDRPLFINPAGGNVTIGLDGVTTVPAKLTIHQPLQGIAGTNTLFGAGYSTYYMAGNREFWIQQWLNAVTAKTYLVGNGFVSGATPNANNGPYTPFEAIEFSDTRFGFVWNNAGSIAPAVSVDPYNGNVGIGTNSINEKLDVAGNIKVSGSIKNEGGKPAFFVSVYADDCGWSHSYLGCPSGYGEAGRWHTGPGNQCDSAIEGVGYENGSIDRGWMVLCVAQ